MRFVLMVENTSVLLECVMFVDEDNLKTSQRHKITEHGSTKVFLKLQLILFENEIKKKYGML